ncbi:hypothetical protein PUNSTDRAFT_146814 [Punctularia strigosozonata HHB-11173 SS5]|uniref:Uncharacterized protein n=1 Tax=Punctularia strigosozonata (strain HHB-11173) TaxID=741275 RepID=R7S0U4_PUNST|nr:uncharacterized protein PUNSTDRAFT_146814 [Punctularia strigosozonata HHB-11173 SS5]EIN03828.1 hypothetical protein PUNSTDRAFT_146814 [Punctularia strigosozonata HHB-11173 SS5]
MADNKKFLQVSVLNNSSYILQPHEPSTVTVQGKLVSKPDEVKPGHRRSGGIWQAEVIPFHLPPHSGVGPVEFPGVQALSLYQFKEAPGVVLVILVEETFTQTAKVAFVRADEVKFDKQYLETLESAASVHSDTTYLFHIHGHPFAVEAKVQFLPTTKTLEHSTVQVTFSNAFTIE